MLALVAPFASRMGFSGTSPLAACCEPHRRNLRCAGTVTDTFTVDPPHVPCSTTAGAISSAGGAGAASGLRAARTTDGTCSENEPDVCSANVDIKSPGRVPHRGAIAADARCTSSQRDALEGFTADRLTDLGLAGDLVYYARRHRVTLPDDAWAVFEIGADDSRYLRPYLVLTRGHADGGTGTVVARAGGTGARTQIGPVFLEAGDYTVEATTAAAFQHGGYTLTAEITATGLAASYGG